MKRISQKHAPMSKDEGSDWALMQATATHRDVTAFQELVQRHHNAASNLAFRITHNRASAEDIVQEALLTVWLSAGCYRQTGKVSSWILRIVALKSMRHVRDRHRRRRQMVKISALPEPSSPSTLTDIEHHEELNLLRRALNHLSNAEQHMLALYFDEGLSKTEAGKTLSLSNSTMAYRVRNCLSKLRVVITN